MDTFALLLTYYGVQVSDLPVADSASIVDAYEIPGRAVRMVAENDVLYVVTIDDGFYLFDISNLPEMTPIGHLTYDWGPQDVVVDDAHAFVLSQDSLFVVDCTDPQYMEIVAVAGLDSGFSTFLGRVRWSNSVLYVCSKDLYAFDVSPPEDISLMYRIETPFLAFDVIDEDSLLIVADCSQYSPPSESALRVFDVSDTLDIAEVYSYPLNFISIHSMAERNDTLLVSHGLRGISMWNIEFPSSPDLQNCFLTGSTAEDFWIDSTWLYINSNRVDEFDTPPRYTICTPLDSIQISDCSYPSDSARLPLAGALFRTAPDGGELCISGQLYGISEAQKIRVRSDTVYTIDFSRYLTITDIAEGSGAAPIASFELPTDNLVNFILVDQAAYLCAAGDGLITVDLRQVSSPQISDVWDNGGSVLDVACEADIAAVADEGGIVALLDISDRLHPVEITRLGSGYFTSVALTHNVLYAADRFTGIWVIDVTSPDSPAVLDTLAGSVSKVAAHGNVLAALDGGCYTLYDISNPFLPLVAVDSCTEYAFGMQLNEDILVLSQGFDGFEVIDVSDAETPKAIGRCMTVLQALDATYEDGYLWVADWGGIVGYELDALTGMNEGPGGSGESLPTSCALYQNYPNPFNASTTITFSLSRASEVKLEVFDVTGRLVSVIMNRRLAAGTYAWNWPKGRANSLSSGVYLYRISTAEGSLSRKMILLK